MSRSVVSWVSTVRDIDRLRQIVTVLVRHGFGEVVQRTGLARVLRRPEETGNDVTPSKTNGESPGMGVRMRLALQDLGPTFVKLGQILSTRADLFPDDFIKELAELQDQVRPVPFGTLRKEVEAELGATIEETFDGFNESPLASASIAQVHRAKLKCADGETIDVVVKIQRPRIKSLIERDVELLYLLARAIERSIPEARIYRPVGLAAEFDRVITAELDFVQEADHAERFLAAFDQERSVRFPRVYREASGKRVITLEFIEGLKLNTALEGGVNGKLLAQRTLHVLFTQIFEHGFFHGDPHPGNLMILGAPEDPILGMIDLGMVGRLTPQLRDKTIDLMLAAARRDPQGIADALYIIGTPTRKIDRNRYEAEVTFLAERYLGKPLKEIKVSLLIRDVIYGATKYGLEIPPDFMMLARTLLTVEGVGKRMHPDLDVFAEIQPFFLRLVRQRYSPERLTNSITRTLTRLSERAQHLPETLDEIIQDLRRGEMVINTRNTELPGATDLLGRRIFSGLTVASLIGGGSLLVASGAAQVFGYMMLSAAGVWLLGHGVRAARSYRRMTR